MFVPANTLDALIGTIENGTNEQALAAAIKFTGVSHDVDPGEAFCKLYEALASTDIGVENIPAYEDLAAFLEEFGTCEEIADICEVELIKSEQAEKAPVATDSQLTPFDHLFKGLETSCYYDAADTESDLAEHRTYVAIAFRAMLVESGMELKS